MPNGSHHPAHHDRYILRLTNTVIGNQEPLLSANKDKATIRIPGWLQEKGKCNVRVMDMNVSLRNGAGNRVVANGTYIVAIRADFPQLGWSNEQNGPPQILGSGIIVDNNANAVKLDAASAMEFTCVRLPSQVTLERMCYDPDNDHNLIPADSFTTDTVPFQVDLELIFHD